MNAAVALVKMIKNMPVTRLDLASNNLTDEGVKIVLRAVEHLPTLKFLNLSSNNIGNQGMDCIC
jgi:Leucine-rich repeat (LRR) protein